MHPARHVFLPHHKSGARAHCLNRFALFVYILALFTLGTTLRVGAQSGQILAYATNIYEQKIVELTNAEREKEGLSTLTVNEELSEAAKNKASDMFADNYWAHIAPDGTTPWFFIKEQGYDFQVAGENLARDFDDSTSVVKAWMNSPSHRDNIVTPQFSEIGVAVVNGKLQGSDTTLVVQLFGAPKGVSTSTMVKPTTPAVPKTVSGVQETAVNSTAKPVGMPFVGAFVPLKSVLKSYGDLSVKVILRLLVMIFVIFLIGMFTLDLLVAGRKSPFRITGSTLAHLSILIFIMVVLILSTGGIII